MTAEDQSPPVNVSYTVKELFEDIKRELENLNSKLDAKADKVELMELSREVADIRVQFTRLERMVNELETSSTAHSEASSAVSEWNRWVIPVILSVAFLAIGVVQLVRG